MDKESKNPAEVGSGIVDFKRIFASATESGMKYFFVEQDQAPQHFQNVTNSYNYLKKLLELGLRKPIKTRLHCLNSIQATRN